MTLPARAIARRVLIGLFAGIVTAGCFVTTVNAQFFDERFPFEQRRAPAYQPYQRAAPVDSSHAPSPRKYDKNDNGDLSTVMVMGDSMADWLGYGLEAAFSQGICKRRRHDDRPERPYADPRRPSASCAENAG
jgi:hypothetical protein